MTQQNIVATFLARAAAQGDRPFLIHAGGTLGFDALDRETGRLARQLLDLGAAPGDRILVQVEKSATAVLLYVASLRAGLVYVPLNTAYVADELAYFIGDADPAIIVCRPEDAVAVSAIAGTAAVRTLAADGSGSLTASLGDGTAPVAMRAADDTACILYTSGTTGRSKGAMLSHGNLLSNALTLDALWCWSARDVLLHVLPIYHVHGLFVALHGALLAGATVLFHAGFDAAAAIAAFDRATVMMGVPTHYARLLARPELTRAACATMRLFVSGSAPLLAATHDRFATETGHRILERYGMTETGMIASNPYDGARIAGTVGHPLPGVEVRVPGRPAVLEVRGPNVTAGYWRNPEKTAEAFTADGWFITGDLAEQADDGRITLVGREKDLIIAGGLNIYPSEIEDVIDGLPGVEESAVIGVPHADLGEAVVAVVVPAATDSATAETVLAGVAPRLARFKQPRHVAIVSELPRNAMGKVQKAALRQRYARLFAGG